MKDPGNEDVLEDGTYKNINREAIKLLVAGFKGYQLQVRISFMHNWNARAFFCCDLFICKNKAIC